MNSTRLRERIDNSTTRESGSDLVSAVKRLPGYRFEFNKRLGNGTAAANLTPDPSSEVFGIAYRLTPEQLTILDDFEGVSSGHYIRQTTRLFPLVTPSESNGSAEAGMKAEIYVCVNPKYLIEDPEQRFPCPEYLAHILTPRDLLPANYVQRLIDLSLRDQKQKSKK